MKLPSNTLIASLIINSALIVALPTSTFASSQGRLSKKSKSSEGNVTKRRFAQRAAIQKAKGLDPQGETSSAFTERNATVTEVSEGLRGLPLAETEQTAISENGAIHHQSDEVNLASMTEETKEVFERLLTVTPVEEDENFSSRSETNDDNSKKPSAADGLSREDESKREEGALIHTSHQSPAKVLSLENPAKYGMVIPKKLPPPYTHEQEVSLIQRDDEKGGAPSEEKNLVAVLNRSRSESFSSIKSEEDITPITTTTGANSNFSTYFGGVALSSFIAILAGATYEWYQHLSMKREVDPENRASS